MLLLKTIRGALAFVAMLATCLMTASQNANAGPGLNCLDQTGCCNRCPACDHYCDFSVDVVDEKKECFEVESKVICIPRVVFPWQRNCNTVCNNGARTRRVCVLKTKEYKCPKCEYTWEAKKKPCCESSTHEASSHENVSPNPLDSPASSQPSDPIPPTPVPSAPAPVAPVPTEELPAPRSESVSLDAESYFSLFAPIPSR